MGAKYTESQAKATAKYMKDKHTFRLVVTNERKESIKKHADKYDNGNVTSFINRAIDHMINIDLDKTEYNR